MGPTNSSARRAAQINSASPFPTDPIFGTEGSAGNRTESQKPVGVSRIDPSAAWPFSRSEPETDQEWRKKQQEDFL